MGETPGGVRPDHEREVELHQAIVYAKTLKDQEAATAAWREHINVRRRKKGLPEIPVAGADTTPDDAVHGRLRMIAPHWTGEMRAAKA